MEQPRSQEPHQLNDSSNLNLTHQQHHLFGQHYGVQQTASLGGSQFEFNAFTDQDNHIHWPAQAGQHQQSLQNYHRCCSSLSVPCDQSPPIQSIPHGYHELPVVRATERRAASNWRGPRESQGYEQAACYSLPVSPLAAMPPEPHDKLAQQHQTASSPHSRHGARASERSQGHRSARRHGRHRSHHRLPDNDGLNTLEQRGFQQQQRGVSWRGAAAEPEARRGGDKFQSELVSIVAEPARLPMSVAEQVSS